MNSFCLRQEKFREKFRQKFGVVLLTPLIAKTRRYPARSGSDLLAITATISLSREEALLCHA